MDKMTRILLYILAGAISLPFVVGNLNLLIIKLRDKRKEKKECKDKEEK